MYAANRFPVMLYYEGGPVGYAEGGLHDEAMAVKKAGRNGDSRLVHVNDEEFAEMVAEYGEPTINPETGMPEFFLGKLFKVFKTIAPIAVSFIPGVGPVAGAALGAGMGALGGGGVKGALLGAASGALGGSGAAGKIGGTLLGKGASVAAQKALGDAIIGGAFGAATGQNPLQAALMSGGTSFLRGQLGPKPTTPTTGTPTTAAEIPTAAPATMAAPTTPTTTAAPATAAPTTAAATAPAGGSLVSTAPPKPSFWNQDFLGLGIAKNKYALPAIFGAAALADALKPKDKTGEMTQEEFFKSFNTPRGPGGFQLASIASGLRPESPAAGYAKRYFTDFNVGGGVGGEGRSGGSSFAVSGPGDGRSDEIPAMLSDGEYVFDAETVALLGNGSPKAGAKKLDDLRVKVRKHKGKKLAKGKFSSNAKAPEQYMAGGRI